MYVCVCVYIYIYILQSNILQGADALHVRGPQRGIDIILWHSAV